MSNQDKDLNVNAADAGKNASSNAEMVAIDVEVDKNASWRDAIDVQKALQENSK